MTTDAIAGDSPAWPKEVRRAFESARSIGLDPVVTGTPGGSWLVAVEGEHVRATAAFEHRGGKTKQVAGELTVDGEPRPLAGSWEELREAWDRHELGVTAPAGLMEVTDPGRVPPPDIVRTTAGIIEARAPGVPVRTGTSGEHWVIAADGRDGDGLRLVFTRCGRSWGLDEDRPVQVVVNGEDRSAEAEGDIGKAMALAFGGSHPPDPAAPAAPARRQPAARSNGVETRRMVVIRELPGPPAPPPEEWNAVTDPVIAAATEAYNAALSVLTSRPWRQGMSEPCNLYALAGEEPDRVNDGAVGYMKTPELAEEACAAHNAALIAGRTEDDHAGE